MPEYIVSRSVAHAIDNHLKEDGGTDDCRIEVTVYCEGHEVGYRMVGDLASMKVDAAMFGDAEAFPNGKGE